MVMDNRAITAAGEHMALDSIRILTTSAGQLWQRLGTYGTLEALPSCSSFEEWLRSAGHPGSLNQIEELQLRRDYRQLYRLLTQIETLVHSQSLALELVRSRADEIKQC